MAEVLSGTVTFLFTGVEGSTRLWEEHPDAMQDLLVRRDAIEAIDSDRHSCACRGMELERVVAVRLADRLISARVSARL